MYIITSLLLWMICLSIHADSTAIDFKYVIVGGGPGGLQMAKFLHSTGRSYILLEKTKIASAFVKYPIHRQLISVNKQYAGRGEGHEFNMRHDWNSLLYTTKDLDSVPAPPFTFRNYSTEYLPHADRLVEYLRDFAKHYKLNVRENTKVSGVFQQIKATAPSKQRLFTLDLQHSNGTKYTMKCERIIWATGRSKAVPLILIAATSDIWCVLTKLSLLFLSNDFLFYFCYFQQLSFIVVSSFFIVSSLSTVHSLVLRSSPSAGLKPNKVVDDNFLSKSARFIPYSGRFQIVSYDPNTAAIDTY